MNIRLIECDIDLSRSPEMLHSGAHLFSHRSRGCLTLRSSLLRGEVKHQLEASDLVPDLETLFDTRADPPPTREKRTVLQLHKAPQTSSHFTPFRHGNDGEMKQKSCLSIRTLKGSVRIETNNNKTWFEVLFMSGWILKSVFYIWKLSPVEE